MPQDVKIKVDLVETPDVLFNLNSAVPCLDTEGVLIGALLTTLKYASENPSKEVVIFGHTDTSGEHSLNYDVSELRAKAVKSLLDGKADVYASVAKEKSQVIDYQTILKTLSTHYGWSCDPGTPDNSNGPKTQTGLKNFQSEYNQKFSGSLKVDGVIGPKTWGAIGQVIISLVTDVYGNTLPKINYGYSGKGIYPCGESFPIADQEKADYVSKTNRRVEAVFWEKTNAPELKVHGDKNTSVTVEECPVYDDVHCERDVIEQSTGNINDAEFLEITLKPPTEWKKGVIQDWDVDTNVLLNEYSILPENKLVKIPIKTPENCNRELWLVMDGVKLSRFGKRLKGAKWNFEWD